MNRLLPTMTLVLLLLSIIPLPLITAQAYSPLSTKTIDGSSSDWTGTAPATDNSGAYDSSAGEWIWKDAIEDTRRDHAKIRLDGEDWDWDNNYGKYIVATDTDTSGDPDGANVDRLFFAWNDTYLMILLNTSNTDSWGIDYGIAIDTGSGGYTTGTDAYGKNIQFGGGFAPDFEIYVKVREDAGGDNYIEGVTLHNYSSGTWSWIKDLSEGTEYKAKISSGIFKFIEIVLEWSTLGINAPDNVSMIAFAAGTAAGDSAVDSVPHDSTVTDNANEWSDVDTFTNLATVYLTEVNKDVETWADLTEFRISGDSSNLYLMFKLRNTTGIELGDSGAPWIAVTLDYDRLYQEGQQWFPEYANTRASSYAWWNYSIVINLADSRLSGRSYTNTSGAIDANEGSILHVYDKDWNFVGTGSGAIAVDLDSNFIEVSIPWSAIGFATAPDNVYIRFSLITARGWSDYSGGDGGPWDISGTSDALDAMTDASSTWDDVGDGWLDYYVDVWFENGEPTPPPTALYFIEPPTPANWTTVVVGSTYTFTVELDVAGSPAEDQDITFYINGTGYTSTTVKTNASGMAETTYTINIADVGKVLNVTAYHPGNDTIQSDEAAISRYYYIKAETKISLSLNTSNAGFNEPVKAYGYLEYWDGSSWNGLGGKTVKLYVDGSYVDEDTTGSDGYFEITFNAPTYIGSHEVKAVFEGDDSYLGCEDTETLYVHGSRFIDGDPSDWVASLPPHGDMWNFSYGELVWNDTVGTDVRTDLPEAVNESDIVEFRVYSDQYYIYFMIKFRNLTKLGADKSCIFDIAIDRDQSGGSGQSWLPGYSDTNASYWARWEYALRISLARVSSEGTYGAGDWNAAFTIIDSSWSPQSGDWAWFSVDLDSDVVEIAVPWDQIGGAPSIGDRLRFTVISGAAAAGSGDFWGIYGSNALDAVTGYPSTWDDVQDGYVDYYLTAVYGSDYHLHPGSSVSLFWIDPTPANESSVPADVPLTLKVYARDEIHNRLGHYTFRLVNVSSGATIATSESDGLGYVVFTVTLPAGTHTLKVVFDGSGEIPAGETDPLVLHAEPIYPTNMSLSWELLTDADGNGYVTPGDTVRLTVKITYYNSSDGKYYPLSGVDVRLNSTVAGVDETLTTDSTGTATYDWSVTDIGGPKFVRFDATYEGNETAAGTPRFSGSSASTYVPYYIARIVDGDLSDWTGALPSTTPGINVDGMEFIVTDPSSDMRTERRDDWDWPHPYDLDILEARLLMDKYELYGMFRFTGNTSPYKVIMVVIDIEPFNDTSAYLLPADANTELAVVDGSTIKRVSWDYIIWINPGADLVRAFNYTSTGEFPYYMYTDNVGDVETSDNAKTLEFYAKWSEIGVDGSTLAGKKIRVWILVFPESWGRLWDPVGSGVSKIASRVYDIAGVNGTAYVEVYDDDGSYGTDVWPLQDHWIEVGYELSIGSDYTLSLTPTATVSSASVIAPTKLSIGEVGNVTVIVSPTSEGNYVELKDHDSGELIWDGVTGFAGVSRLGVVYNVKGLHTVDVYVDGVYMTSFTVNITGYKSRVTITLIDLVDTDGDGLPDRINVTGKLEWYNGTSWLPLVNNESTIKLVYVVQNLTETVITNVTKWYYLEEYTITLGTVTTDSDGVFTLETDLSLPAGYPVGGYAVVVEYAGDALRRSSEARSPELSGVHKFVPLYGTLPSVTWTLSGTTTGLYTDGSEVLIVDDTGDYATDYLSGTIVVDLEELRFRIASGYLVIRLDYSGDLSAALSGSGNSAPFFVLLLDTTPSDYTDGVDDYLWIPSGYSFAYAPYEWPNPPYSDLVAGLLTTYVGSSITKYTVALVLSPVEPSNAVTNYIVWLITIENGKVVAKPVGVLELTDPSNGVYTGYIPLSTIGISGVMDVRMWFASGAIYTGGSIYGRELVPLGQRTGAYADGRYWWTLIYDVPGSDYVPPSGFPNVDSAKYNWSVLFNVDSSGPMSVYAILDVEAPSDVLDGIIYAGYTTEFSVSLKANYSDIPIPRTVRLLNDSAVIDSGTAPATLSITPDVGERNKTYTLRIEVADTTGLIVSPSTFVEYSVKVYVKLNATGTVSPDRVSPGGTITIDAMVYFWNGTGWEPLRNTELKVYLLVDGKYKLLGTASTDGDGRLYATFTVPESALDPMIVIGYLEGGYMRVVITDITGTPISVLVIPAPETPILPIILLVAILLLLLLKRKRL